MKPATPSIVSFWKPPLLLGSAVALLFAFATESLAPGHHVHADGQHHHHLHSGSHHHDDGGHSHGDGPAHRHGEHSHGEHRHDHRPSHSDEDVPPSPEDSRIFDGFELLGAKKVQEFATADLKAEPLPTRPPNADVAPIDRPGGARAPPIHSPS